MGRVRPDNAHGHSRTQVGNTLAGKFGGHTVTVACWINHRADLHDSCADRAAGIAHQDQTDRGAVRRTLGCGLWNLELHLERSQLADPKEFVAFGDLLSFSDIANHDGTR